MSLDRKFRACFISLVLLISSLSIIAVIPEKSMAQSAGNTTLYFHDVPVEGTLDDEIVDLLSLVDFGGDFDEIWGKIEELEQYYLDNYENLTDSEIEDIEDQILELYDLLLGSERLDIGNVIDENPPIKTNDSEYPPTLRRFVELFFNGDLISFIKNLLSGGELDEDMLIEFEGLIMEMMLSLASFRGYYVYNGEESVSLDGEVMLNLYFSSPLNYILDSDTANISFVVYDVDLNEYTMEPKITESESIMIKRQLFNPFKDSTLYEIPIMVNTELEPGDIIMADIDIIAGEKSLFGYIDQINISELGLNETFEALAELINSTGITQLDPLADMLLNLSLIVNEDFSTEQITSILGELTSSFIYDSVSHPSSITLPTPISGANEENIKTYYLHSGNIMDETPPEDSTSQADLKSVAKWDGPALERGKVIKEATASLYIDHQNFFRILNFFKGNIKITASLLYGGEEIASSTESFGKNTIFDAFTKPSEATTFSFSDLNQEINYGDSLSLEVVSNGTKFGILNFRRNVKLLYGSSDFPSSLVLKFDETDNIVISGDESDKIVALGESIEYNLTITSEFAEEISMEVYDFSKSEMKDWDIDFSKDSFSIDAGGQENIIVTVTSTDSDLDAYDRGDKLKVTFAAEGKTGKGLLEATVEISEDAVEYNIDVTADSLKQKIRHGENNTFEFTIKNNNTGLWPDSYAIEVESTHDWASYSIDEDDLKNIDTGSGLKVDVTVSVPRYTDVTSDKLSFKVVSKESNKKIYVVVNVTTTVESPNILENLYHFFESLGQDVGLDEAMGSSSNAAIFLASMVFIIIFLLIIIFVYILSIKYVNIVCLNRIKEISPDEEARFEITIQNPYKQGLSYEINTVKDPSNKGWKVSLDAENILLEAKQSKTVVLTVKPTDFVKPDDWIEVGVVVRAVEKQKTAKISTVTTIKNAKPELRISGMIHWPTSFKKGDKVTTSFKLRNEGNAAASNVRVVLYVNGKEKNKVEDITIPRGAYADIEIPWVAVKGKNEVNIEVN